MKYITFFAIAICLFSFCTSPEPVGISLVPYPTEIETGSDRFSLNSKTQLVAKNLGEFAAEVEFLQSLMDQAIGQKLTGKSGGNTLEINNYIPLTEKKKVVKDFKVSLEGKEARYIKVIAANVQKGYLFVDKLVIN